ncbi:MAG: YjfB family protein [Pseudomonadota bacterium]
MNVNVNGLSSQLIPPPSGLQTSQVQEETGIAVLKKGLEADKTLVDQLLAPLEKGKGENINILV